MADISEVGDTLRDVIAKSLYPQGNSFASTVGLDVIVYQGWPNSQTLQDDLAARKVHISIFPWGKDRVTWTELGDTEWNEEVNDGTIGVGIREVRRQTQKMLISIWASNPADRDAVAKPVDLAMALIVRMMLPDGSVAMVTKDDTSQHDERQKEMIYRRDLIYAVNYPTTVSEREYSIKHVQINLSGGPTPDAQGPPITLIT